MGFGVEVTDPLIEVEEEGECFRPSSPITDEQRERAVAALIDRLDAVPADAKGLIFSKGYDADGLVHAHERIVLTRMSDAIVLMRPMVDETIESIEGCSATDGDAEPEATEGDTNGVGVEAEQTTQETTKGVGVEPEATEEDTNGVGVEAEQTTQETKGVGVETEPEATEPAGEAVETTEEIVGEPATESIDVDGTTLVPSNSLEDLSQEVRGFLTPDVRKAAQTAIDHERADIHARMRRLSRAWMQWSMGEMHGSSATLWEEETDANAPEWLSAPPPPLLETMLVDQEANVLEVLQGVLPPHCMDHLAGVRGATLLTRDGGRRPVYRMGRNVCVGKYILDVTRFENQSYRCTEIHNMPIPQGSISRMHRLRRQVFERR